MCRVGNHFNCFPGTFAYADLAADTEIRDHLDQRIDRIEGLARYRDNTVFYWAEINADPTAGAPVLFYPGKFSRYLCLGVRFAGGC